MGDEGREGVGVIALNVARPEMGVTLLRSQGTFMPPISFRGGRTAAAETAAASTGDDGPAERMPLSLPPGKSTGELGVEE